MREINTKDIMAAYIKYKNRESCVKSCAGAIPEVKLEVAAARDAAHEALSAALEPIEIILREVQKRCSARTISGKDILAALVSIEDRLCITKKAMDGITVSVDINGQSFPNAYKGVPESTIFSARYKAGSWRITNISRGTTRGVTNRYQVHLTDEAREAVIRSVSKWG